MLATALITLYVSDAARWLPRARPRSRVKFADNHGVKVTRLYWEVIEQLFGMGRQLRRATLELVQR